METQVDLGISRRRRTRSILTALVLLSVATIALAASLFLWTQFQGGVPAINWFIAVICGFTAIGFVGTTIISRGSPKMVLVIIAACTACAAVGFLWGPRGVLLGVVAGSFVNSLVAWLSHRKVSPNKSLERTRDR